MVLEKLEGEDLEDHLAAAGRLPLEEALAIARQVCRGLSAAHSVGVIHRDLKPSNIFLVNHPKGGLLVKLLDFGVAKLREDANLTATGAVLGTPAYMPPEQARSSARVDARGDIYGVGAVLYCMLTGRPPYEGADATSTLATLLEREPVRPSTLDPTIPIGMEALIQRAMARDPEARPQTIEQLDAELAAFEGSLGPTESQRPILDPMASVPGGVLSVLPPAMHSETAAEITRRARRVRPLAVGLAVPAAVAAAGGVAAMLAAFVSALGEGAPLTSTETVLVAGGAGLAAVAVLGVYVHALVKSWSAGPAVEALWHRAAIAVVIGLVTLGVLEVGARSVGVALGSPLSSSGVGVTVRYFVALCAAVGWLIYVLRRRR